MKLRVCKRCKACTRQYVRGFGFLYCLRCYGKIYGYFED